MNPFLFRKDNLDEVVFENRNKQYGAYVLRKSYDSNLLKASASSFGILFLFVGMVYVLSLFRKQIEPIADPVHITPVETIICNIEYVLDPPAASAAPAVRNINPNVFRIVRDQLVIPKPAAVEHNPELPDNPTAIENGEPGGQIGGTNPSGTNTTIINAPAALPAELPFETSVSEMPSFPGGMDAMTSFIARQMVYPTLARENGIEGKVVLSFVIMTDGSIAHLKVEKGIGFGCDDEALRVIRSMPTWNAGKQNGKLRAVKLILPITFKLQ